MSLIRQEEGINQIHEAVRLEKPSAVKQMQTVLEELASSCTRYITAKISGSNAGKTPLDQERIKLCQREVVSMRIGGGGVKLMSYDTWYISKCTVCLL